MTTNLQTAFRKLNTAYSSSVFHFILIAVGVILRFRHYWENRSLWVDEAYVAVQITARNWPELLSFFPIFPRQPASPWGFMVIERIITDLLGPSEMALRLFPFLCSCLSLILFYYFLKRFARMETVGLALTLFAFNPRLIYYAAEVKTYSLDVLVSLVLLIIVWEVHRRDYQIQLIHWLGIYYALAMWFSFSSMFVIASIGSGMGIYFLIGRDFRKLTVLARFVILWLINLAAFYKLCFQYMMVDEGLVGMWERGILLVPLFSEAGWIWFKNAITNIFRNPMAVHLPVVSGLIFLAGCIGVSRRNKYYFYWLVLPVILVFVASLLRKYPFQGRMLLFLMPAFCLILAEGVSLIARQLPKGSSVTALVLAGLLILHPVTSAWTHMRQGYFYEDNRPVMQYVQNNYQPGDLIFLNDQGVFIFFYYIHKLKFHESLPKKPKRIDGRDLYVYSPLGRLNECFYDDRRREIIPYRFIEMVGDDYGRYWGEFQKPYCILKGKGSLNFLGGRRIWLLFLHEPSLPVRQFILDLFGRNGRHLQSIELRRASAYLFDLSKDHGEGNKEGVIAD